MPHQDYGSALTKQLTVGEITGLLDLVQSCMECSTVAELDDVLAAASKIVPFECYACLFSQNCTGNWCDSYQLVTTTYSDGWVRLYIDREYHLIDPIMLECRECNGLVYWADVYAKRPTDREFVKAAADFGLVDGYSSGIRNLSGSRCGIVSVSGREFTKSQRNDLVLGLIVPHIYQAMDRIIYRQKLEDLPKISPREKEVLRWITHGKTSWETSVILGMSERTVKYHVSNLMKKLNASSRTHAAAIALERNLVELE